MVRKVIFYGPTVAHMRLEDRCCHDFVWRSDSQLDGLRLIEGMVLPKLRGLLQRDLNEPESVPFDGTRPSRYRFADQLGGSPEPFELNVVTILRIVDAV